MIRYILATLLATSAALAALPETSKQNLPDVNVLTNGGAENGRAGWSSSGAVPTLESLAPISGTRSLLWDAGAASEYIQTEAKAMPRRLRSNVCEASISYEWTGGTLGHLIWQAHTGSSPLGQVTLVPTTTDKPVSTARVTFNCPPTGAIAGRLVSTANAAVIKLDDAYVGSSTRVVSIETAKHVGSLRYAATSLCSWNTTSTVYANFAADTDCPTPTVTGGVSAPATKIPGFVLASMPKGVYQVIANARYIPGSITPASEQAFRLSDGTTASGYASTIVSGTARTNDGQIIATFVNPTDRTNVTIQIQALTSNASVQASVPADFTGAENGLDFQVYYYSKSDAIAPDPVTPFYVSANIGGANPNLNTVNLSTYTEITNASLDLVNNAGSVPAQILCSGTNPSTGTTCAAGDESVGISFEVPKAGPYQACATFAHLVATSAAGNAEVTFQIIETPNNATTILQEGKMRAYGSYNAASSALGLGNNLRLCGIFRFESSGRKNLRLMREQLFSGTVTLNLLVADRDGATGQRDMHWEVYPIADGGSPLTTLNLERIYRAKIATCSASPCTITSQNGPWLTSVTRTSTGVYVANFISGTFTQAPVCFSSSSEVAQTINPSTSSVQVNTLNVPGLLSQDSRFDLLCSEFK